MPRYTSYTRCRCGVMISNEGLWAVCTECHHLAPVSAMGFRCIAPENERKHHHRVENTHKRCRQLRALKARRARQGRRLAA